jgi:hypothetical protein
MENPLESYFEDIQVEDPTIPPIWFTITVFLFKSW